MEGHPPQLPPGADANIGQRVLTLIWVEFGITVPFVVTRIITRARVVRSLGWDDWTILFAMVLSLATSIVVSMQVHYGLGRHIFTLSIDKIQNNLKTSIASQPLSTFSACFAKISVALLLKRMMHRNKPQEYFLYFIIASLLIVNIILNVETFAQCEHVSALWSLERKGRCLSPNVNANLGVFQGAWSIFADVALALFPILILWNLQIRTKIKVGIIVLMSLGLLASAAAVVRVYEVKKSPSSKDFTWDQVNVVYWFSTENYLIIITACIPTLKPLYPKLKSLYSQYITSRQDKPLAYKPPSVSKSRTYYQKHSQGRDNSDVELTVSDGLPSAMASKSAGEGSRSMV